MSEQDQDLTIGRLVREYSERRRSLVAMEAKLNRVGRFLQSAGTILQNLKPENYESSAQEAEGQLSDASADVDIAAVLHLLKDYVRLNTQISRDKHQLRQYGIEC